MLARNSPFVCMLPSMSMETKVSARRRSSAFVSFVSRARFQELSKARMWLPASELERADCCGHDIVTPNSRKIAAAMVRLVSNSGLRDCGVLELALRIGAEQGVAERNPWAGFRGPELKR